MTFYMCFSATLHELEPLVCDADDTIKPIEKYAKSLTFKQILYIPWNNPQSSIHCHIFINQINLIQVKPQPCKSFSFLYLIFPFFQKLIALSLSQETSPQTAEEHLHSRKSLKDWARKSVENIARSWKLVKTHWLSGLQVEQI